jgi:hypothetical protein
MRVGVVGVWAEKKLGTESQLLFVDRITRTSNDVNDHAQSYNVNTLELLRFVACSISKRPSMPSTCMYTYDTMLPLILLRHTEKPQSL